MPAVDPSPPPRPAAMRPSEPQGSAVPARFKLALAILLVGFGIPLYQLVSFALNSDLYSYILLIPVVSIYLAWGHRRTEPPRGTMPVVGIILAGLGAIPLAVRFGGSAFVPQDALALSTVSFVLFVGGVAAAFLDRTLFRKLVFPLCFLLFMVPFPVAMEHFIEAALQHGSAPPAFWFFRIAGTPVYKEDLIFQLPGMTLQIAPECSGIRSTLVLFMTSLVAGHLFLRSPWRRGILAAAVIPLALLRNGFRVFVIGELCVHIGPHMIDSVIHHKGGPIFFALSLIPFSILVYFLFRSDRPDSSPVSPVAP